jgi:hypothetical protein
VVAADFRQAKRSASGDHSRITLLSEYWEWAADNLNGGKPNSAHGKAVSNSGMGSPALKLVTERAVPS